MQGAEAVSVIELFRGISTESGPGDDGDVTHAGASACGPMAVGHGHGSGTHSSHIPEVAVENLNFSTNSTGFSTGVFHRTITLWSLHKYRRQISTAYVLFCVV